MIRLSAALLLVALLTVALHAGSSSSTPSRANPIAQDKGQTNTKHTRRLADGEKQAPATLADVKWLQGEWVGEGFGGTAHETWTAPLAGTMAGTFRLAVDGKLTFSEFFMLTEENKSLSLKLKHFDAKFKGWEEKEKFVEFKLIEIKGQTAWFEGLTYQLDDKGRLHAYVAITAKDGSLNEGELVFRRRPRGEQKARSKQ